MSSIAKKMGKEKGIKESSVYIRHILGRERAGLEGGRRTQMMMEEEG